MRNFLWLAIFLALPVFAQTPPQYAVDPSWPHELPSDWILGQVSGIAVDSADHIWIIHRPRSIADTEMGMVLNPPIASCCKPAPSVLEFDAEGELLQSWGGPQWNVATQSWDAAKTPWPATEHGIYVDAEQNVWIAGNGANDHLVLKFSSDGQHLLTIGKPGETGGSNDTERLGQPADMTVDIDAHEVYIADGYLNRRVIVFDSDTGTYKRHWGAFGNRPDDSVPPPYEPGIESAQQFRGAVHSVELSADGLVYVADRASDRIQVFNKDGSFVKEALIAPATLSIGSAWDMALSKDATQQWLFLADGQNMKVHVLDRNTLKDLAGFGRGGRQAGQFNWVHNITVDSQGNVYTAEVNNGRRIQKFRPIADGG
jgi:DNA-binding beta-propeller fold protein YncE